MSIQIDKKKCTSCNKCSEVCPGNLIYMNDENKAFIKYPRDCWGCAACVKECKFSAIKYYLGADIGGKGTYITINEKKESINFVFNKNDTQKVIEVSRKESNKY